MPTVAVLPLAGPFAITFEDGDAVVAAVDAADDGIESITLDFAGVRIMGAPFLNAVVGPLVGSSPAGDRWQRVTVANLSDLDRRLLERVIENQYECRDVPGMREALARAVERAFSDD
jgi:hypothetical protein